LIASFFTWWLLSSVSWDKTLAIDNKALSYNWATSFNFFLLNCNTFF
jgi:hypothetical protein